MRISRFSQKIMIFKNIRGEFCESIVKLHTKNLVFLFIEQNNKYKWREMVDWKFIEKSWKIHLPKAQTLRSWKPSMTANVSNVLLFQTHILGILPPI